LRGRQVRGEALDGDAGEACVRHGLEVDGDGRLPKRRHELAVAHQQARPCPGGDDDPPGAAWQADALGLRGRLVAA